MTNQNIPVTRSSMPPLNEFVEEIRDLWDSRWLTNYGEKHSRLAEALRDLMDAENLVLFTNGHQALEAAFQQFPKGSEVITSPFTYASTTQAIVRCGLIPVFCDIEPDYYTLDPGKLKPLVTGKTVAIAAIHVYGNICRHDSLSAIANKYHLKLIYDAAHTFGMRYLGKSVAALGDMSMFSFHATKVFHTFEGGCLVCKRKEDAEAAKDWSRFGMKGQENAEIVGTNAKMTEIQAAMGLCNLNHLDHELSLRKRAVERYREHFEGIRGIYLCPPQQDVVSNYAYFPVRFHPEQFGKSRDDVKHQLEKEGISARKYFSPLTSEFSAYRGLFPIQKTPIAEEISEEILCLPLYADLSEGEVDRICGVVLQDK